jgi:hypothetical protein
MCVRRFVSAFALSACLLAPFANAGVIVVAPGASPAGGYLPLSAFGIGPLAGVGDETINNVDVPSFAYAGQTWTRLGIVSNGYVVVGGGTIVDVETVNLNLPSASAPANILAPFWTDLNPSFGGLVRVGVLTDGIDRWIVVDWEGVRNFVGGAPNSFQIWIGESGDANPGEDITFAYGEVTAGSQGLLTVGAQDASRTVGDTYYFNGVGTGPTNGTQLRVTTRDLPVAVPEPATVALVWLGLLGLGVSRRPSPHQDV